eukprot:GILI01018147.1.p1 GENE.GILI01018147.1~~GILI01018147.1.p1  ORF type:complete len:616 (-),score=61.72 GILI01018147.1:70-1743(-)
MKGRTAKDVADHHKHASISRRLLTLMTDQKGLEAGEPQPDSFFSPFASSSDLLPISQALSSLSANVNSSLWSELKPSQFCTVSDDHSLILCLVGLPGRGKSFVSRRISRYFNWKGVPCKVFNVGDYRRRHLGAQLTSSSDFFDPKNHAAKDARERMAEHATEDLLDFIRSHPISVGILDATNTTKERRAFLLQRFRNMTRKSDDIESSDEGLDLRTSKLKAPVRVVFVESICENEEIITENILRAKCGNDDFKGVSPQTVIAEFRERIRQYEKVYESLDSSEDNGKISFIQIIDAKQRIILNNVKGALPSRVAYFLMSLHPVAYPIFVTFPAETVGDVAGEFGGDAKLTANGTEYIRRLRNFIRCRLTSYGDNSSRLRILCSSSPAVERTIQMVLQGPPDDAHPIDVSVNVLRALDDINYGAMAGLTQEEATRRHPKTCGLLFQQPFQSEANEPPSSHESQPDLCMNECATMPTFAYTVSFVRGGESARQVNVRIGSALLEIMRADGPVMIIADPTPAKGVLSFVTDELPENSQYVNIPRHGVVEVGVNTQKIVHLL